ncbi:hypothetical protein LXA43DRAFT_1035600, partial [Ganoderma leucocontextum]
MPLRLPSMIIQMRTLVAGYMPPLCLDSCHAGHSTCRTMHFSDDSSEGKLDPGVRRNAVRRAAAPSLRRGFTVFCHRNRL